MSKKIVLTDIDGVITNEPHGWDYANKTPNKKNVKLLGKLYKKYLIVLFTARDKSDKYVTKKWLKKYKVKYHSIIYGKPKGDYIVDDKSIKLEKL